MLMADMLPSLHSLPISARPQDETFEIPVEVGIMDTGPDSNPMGRAKRMFIEMSIGHLVGDVHVLGTESYNPNAWRFNAQVLMPFLKGSDGGGGLAEELDSAMTTSFAMANEGEGSYMGGLRGRFAFRMVQYFIARLDMITPMTAFLDADAKVRVEFFVPTIAPVSPAMLPLISQVVMSAVERCGLIQKIINFYMRVAERSHTELRYSKFVRDFGDISLRLSPGDFTLYAANGAAYAAPPRRLMAGDVVRSRVTAFKTKALHAATDEALQGLDGDMADLVKRLAQM